MEREQALATATEPVYAGFGPTLLAEHVRRRLGVRASAETMRSWLAQAGRWRRARKRAKRRSRRPRREALGELVPVGQLGPSMARRPGPADLVLVALHDDATGRMLHGRFVERDTGAANRRAIVECLKRHGRPAAVCTDHAAHFGRRTRRASARGRSSRAASASWASS